MRPQLFRRAHFQSLKSNTSKDQTSCIRALELQRLRSSGLSGVFATDSVLSRLLCPAAVCVCVCAVRSARRPWTSVFSVLPGALLLLVLLGVLPGTRTSDVLPLVQIRLLQLLHRGQKNKSNQETRFKYQV